MQHDYPITLHLTPEVSWKRHIKIHAQEHKGVYRIFVQARDGKWYKQKDPMIGRHGRAVALCTFGFEEVPHGSVYQVVALAGDTTLPEVVENITHRTLERCGLTQLSAVYGVARA